MLRRREWIPGLLFASPFLLGLLAFTVYPLASSLYYSFTAFHLTILSTPPIWIGWGNYQEMLTADPLFWPSLWNTVTYTLVSVPLDIAAALVLAVLLNTRVRGRTVFRTIFFLPTIVPTVVVAVTFDMLFQTQGGLINDVLTALHLPAVPWLTSPDWALRSLILMTLWGVGTPMIIFLAGLQDVPAHLYEASTLDGANAWQQFRHITVPMVSPVILFNVILGFINSFQQFTVPYIMTGVHGDPMNSTLLYSVNLYDNAFQNFRMGYASAQAWFLFTIVFALTLITLRLSRRAVHYS